MTAKTTTTPASVRLSALATIGAGLFGLTLEQALRAKPGVLDSIVNDATAPAPVNAAIPAAAPALPPKHVEDDTPLPVSGSGDLISFADKHSAESL